ncbi:Helix-turn-helix domain-containing protein [Halogranum rubrum]|uniref:Helix-turn-helix domain-containing protein n=1 Tax=Halogranum rubrum TaxID=553466 RepID=A0A1I4EF37_9EURY|nr:helix-turn-helix domain-containing protein [Halogranum rubrum]SFL04382.1 Helix-turn-helix domain-containing protein [Halogranum rubrum]
MNRLSTLVVAATVVLLALSAGPLFLIVDDPARTTAPEVASDSSTVSSSARATPAGWANTVGVSDAHSVQSDVLAVSPLSTLATDGVVAPPRLVTTPLVVSVQQGAVQSGEANLLDNDRRRQLYEAIERSPGTYVAQLVETTGIPRSTVRYHLRTLEEAGFVASNEVRGKQRYVTSVVDDAEATLAAAYVDEATATVLDALDGTEPATVSELAETLDRTPGTVSHHLDRLASEGLVDRERSGNAVLNTLAGPARAATEERASGGSEPAVSDD